VAGKIIQFSGVLTTGEVLEALKELDGDTVSQRTLCYWVHSGLVTASVRGPRGRRRAHLFRRDDLLRARLVARLRRDGLPLQRVRLALAHLGDELTDALATGRGRVVVDRERGTARLIRRGRELDALTGQYELPLRELADRRLDETATRIEGTG